MQRQRLEQLRRRFPGQNARDLRMAASREYDLNLSMKEINEFLNSISGTALNKPKETFAPRQMYKGAAAAEGPNERWQADLAIMKKRSQGSMGFLLVVDVYSRMAYAAPVPNNQARTLLDAVRKILKRRSPWMGAGASSWF